MFVEQAVASGGWLRCDDGRQGARRVSAHARISEPLPALASLVCIAICIADVYVPCMAQLVTRVEDDLAAAVDQLVEAGVVANRSEAVRLALEQLVDRCRREEIGARIVRGYRERPQDDVEIAWADESSVRMIAEEPW